MNNKVLSIIVPCYNCSSFIDNLFSHVHFDQLNNEVDFYLINDGSKDNTYEVLLNIQKQYGKDLIHVFNKENGNWGSVHNFAKHLDIKGKYIKTLDSDDYLDPYGLIKFVNFLKKLPDDIDLIFSSVNFINEYDEIVSQKFYDKLFKKDLFKIDEIKITKLSVLTVHAFTMRKEIYTSIPDLPIKMSYMDSVFIFLVVNAAANYCTFFSYAPLYQYQCGNESQTISIQNFVKHADWIKIMVETEAKYAISLKIFEKNSDNKNRILCQMMQLGYFQYCYAIVNNEALNKKQKANLMYELLQEIKKILGKYNFNKFFKDNTIALIYFLKCRLLTSSINIAQIALNSGYLKATRKDGKRKRLTN